jgi:hypothetical protein
MRFSMVFSLDGKRAAAKSGGPFALLQHQHIRCGQIASIKIERCIRRIYELID